MILVVICDGANAKLFKKEKRFSPLEHLQSSSHSHELTHEHGRDKPGRGFGAAASHHAYESPTDWHEHQKEVFARQISSYMIDLIKEKKFSRILIISPAKIANMFRNSLDQHMDTLHKSKLDIREIHKDLIHFTSDEIDKIINKEEGWE